MNWQQWMWLLWLWIGCVIGWFACAQKANSDRVEECSECVWQNRDGSPHPISIEDLCIASGAEGFDIRREVAEQFGCEETKS